jgi:diguanylate cyclase (GGDEF)-like protein
MRTGASLQTKFITAGIFLAVIVLLVITTTAYQSSRNVLISNDIANLLPLSEQIKHQLDGRLATNLSTEFDLLPESMRKDFKIYRSGDRSQLDIINRNLLQQIPTPDNLPGNQHAGYVNANDQDYTWHYIDIEDQQPLLLVHRLPAHSLNVLMSSFSNTMVFTGLVIIWFALWASLYLAKLYGKLKQQNELVQHLAFHDALTDLPNRTLLMDRTRNVIDMATRKHFNAGLVILDLNRFKEINDTLGHDVGDEVLRTVSMRLQRIIRRGDTVARLGGDEFAVLMTDLDAEAVEQAVKRILFTLSEVFNIDNHELFIDASIGVSLYPNHADNADALFRSADMAMYTARKSGGGYMVYEPHMDNSSIDRLHLVNELRTAILQDKLELYFQPQIDLWLNKINSIEVLCRWQHPVRGFIPPDEFISIAEQTGLIKPLTRWVLKTAIHQSCRWQDSGINPAISVNISTWNLLEPDFADYVMEVLDNYRIPADQLTLEITESSMMVNNETVFNTLLTLKQNGIKLSIDDFGTGYSTLNHLRRLPMHEIKVDKSFVFNIHTENADASVVRAMIDLAHDLDLQVVAEGIENHDALALLREMNCDSAQGYQICRPLPAHELEQWLQSYQLHSHVPVGNA